MKTFRKFLLYLLLVLLPIIFISTGHAEKIAQSRNIIVNLKIYESAGPTDYGLYRINVDTGEKALLWPAETSDLISPVVSSNGRYVLGQKYNRKTFVSELYLFDMNKNRSSRVTNTPANKVCRNGKLSGTFEKYSISPDGKFAVIYFPDGFTVGNSKPFPLLVPNQASSKNSALAFINIRRWFETGIKDTVEVIPADEMPVFSPSCNRFMVPSLVPDKPEHKVMVYEIVNSKGKANVPFFGIEIPLTQIYQGAFASENLLYLLSGNDLVLFDLIGSRIKRLESFKDLIIRGAGFFPPQISTSRGFAEGPICFGQDRFAFISSTKKPSVEMVLLEGGGDDLLMPGRLINDPRMMIVYGETESPAFRWIDIPSLPDSMYRQYMLYHQLYFPEGNDKIAILISNNGEEHTFNIVDFMNKTISSPIAGIFIGLSPDNKGLVYLQCGSDGCQSYKGFTNFSWETYKINGKTEAVIMNKLFYMDIKTGNSRILIKEPSHTSQAFFIR